MRIKKTFQGNLPENTVVNTRSNSQTNAYSCNYLNQFIHPTSSTSNGWQVRDFGSYVVYFKNGSFPNTTYGGNGWGYLPDVALPTGVTFDDNKMTFSGTVNCGDSAMTGSCRINSGGSYIYGGWQNKYGGSVTASFRYHFILTVYR